MAKRGPRIWKHPDRQRPDCCAVRHCFHPTATHTLDGHPVCALHAEYHATTQPVSPPPVGPGILVGILPRPEREQCCACGRAVQPRDVRVNPEGQTVCAACVDRVAPEDFC